MQCESAVKRARMDGDDTVTGGAQQAGEDATTAKDLLLRAATRDAEAAARGQLAEADDDNDIWADPAWRQWWQQEEHTEDRPAPARRSPPQPGHAASRPVQQSKPAATGAAGGASRVLQRTTGTGLQAPLARLSAPAFDAGARDFSFADPGGTRAPSTNAPTSATLVSLLPAEERPRLPVELRRAVVCRVPRAKRQTALDLFSSRALAAAASALGVSEEEFARGDAHRAARAEALSHALKAESDVYAQSTSAMVYNNKAAQRLRELHAATSAQAGQQQVVVTTRRSMEERDALLLRCVTLQSTACVEFFQEALAARAHAEYLLWEPPWHWRRKASESHHNTASTAAPADEYPCAGATADGGADDARPVADADEMAPGTRPGADTQTGDVTVAAAAAAAADASAPCVLDAVRAFIRTYVAERAADVLSAEACGRVVERATAKVWARHHTAADAAFLEREAARIQELCGQYIRKEAAACVAAMVTAVKGVSAVART